MLITPYSTKDKYWYYVFRENTQELYDNFWYCWEEWSSKWTFPAYYILNDNSILKVNYTEFTYINNEIKPILSINISIHYLNNTNLELIKPFIWKDNKLKLRWNTLSDLLSSFIREYFWNQKPNKKTKNTHWNEKNVEFCKNLILLSSNPW